MVGKNTWPFYPSVEICDATFVYYNLSGIQGRITHWGRVTHICVGNLTIIVSDNGLSPDRRQAIIWTNAGILLIGTLGTNFGEFFIEIRTFSFKKMGLKVSSAKWRPSCLGLNVISNYIPPCSDSGHQCPCNNLYKLCNHNVYIGIIIFPHIDNTHSAGYNWCKMIITIK